MGEGPYRESRQPWGDRAVMTREAIPEWLRGYCQHDAHVRAVVDTAIHGRWTEARMLQHLVVVLANTKADMQGTIDHLVANRVTPLFVPAD